MSLITEDGSGRADAESLCSVAAADGYHGKRGNTSWTGLQEAAKEQALRKATDYMATYRARWAGYRVSTAQALDWPRYEVPMKDAGVCAVYPSDAVPQAVQNACAELALRSISKELAPDLKPPKTRVKVGPIETEYARGDRQTTTYSAVESMLLPFFSGGSNGLNVKVTRV